MKFDSMLVLAAGFGLALGLALAPAPALAHHSFAAEFDRELPVELTGAVVRLEWLNPHARFYINVEDENGDLVEWDFELSSPNGLMRRGWTRNSLKEGDIISVEGWRAKNAPHVGNARSVTFADGSRVFAGSSGEDD
jgi:hypothetical protein